MKKKSIIDWNNFREVGEYHKNYRVENKNKIRKYREENKDKMNRYYKENKDKIRENHKRYCIKNKEKIAKHKKKRYEENKEKIKLYFKSHNIINKEKFREYSKRRYANSPQRKIYEEKKKLKEKEVTATKKYIKRVWGKETPMRNLSYMEIKFLGEELGINVFGRKNFNLVYDSHGKKRLKYYLRICWKCNKNHKVPVNEKRPRPKGPSVCSICKKIKIFTTL